MAVAARATARRGGVFTIVLRSEGGVHGTFDGFRCWNARRRHEADLGDDVDWSVDLAGVDKLDLAADPGEEVSGGRPKGRDRPGTVSRFSADTTERVPPVIHGTDQATAM